MEWLFSIALIPILLCALMCGVPMALAAFGLRRRSSARVCGDESAEPTHRREHAEMPSR